jgi:hypothetical protein
MENKVNALTLEGLDNYCFPYVKEGTIAFAKFGDGTIRMAKCVKNDFVQCYANSEPNHLKLIQCWKVAGLQGLYWGCPNGTLHQSNYQGKVANLYVNEDNAQFANCKALKGDNVGNCVCDLRQLVKKYNLECGTHLQKAYSFPTLRIVLWKINSVGETFSVRANFHLEYNQDEFELVIPSMDEKRLFATKEDARANYKRKPIITFDDEEEEKTTESEEFVEISIKVKKKDIQRIKEIANDCIEFE